MRAKPIFTAVLLAVAAAPFVAHADLYKWVDDQGVVNYSDSPPAKAKSSKVDESAGTLSVFPGMSKEELARARERSAEMRADRLERENAELRARAAQPPAPEPLPPPDYATYYPAYGYWPVHVRPRVPPHAAHLPVRGKPVQKTPPFASMKLER
jgi:hypothetical protein